MASGFESRLKIQQVFWFGLIGLCAIMMGFYLASSLFTLAFALVAIAWLFLLPYHAQLATALSLTTYTSALILPYFPAGLTCGSLRLFWGGLV